MFKKSLILNIFISTLLVSIFSVSISASGTDDTTPPVSMVTHFTNTDETSDKRECVLENGVKKAYLNYDDVVIHGSSMDLISKIIEIHTRLDSNAQQLGICNDLSCNDGDSAEDWHTFTNNNLAEGLHDAWGRAKDKRLNEESFSNNNKCMFCIDKQAPNKPTTPILSRDKFCDPNYINNEEEDVIFSWSATDNGCSDVSFFDVFVEIDRSGVFSLFSTTNTNSFEVSGLMHGDRVRIKVKATDKAGNVGEFSDFSEWVTIDNEEPDVQITNTNEDEWASGNLEITEIDEDENLFKCFYKVQSGFLNAGGRVTVDWTVTPCNQPFTIDTREVCPRDGKNQCIVSKKAKDKACNERERSKQFDIDNNPPELEKIIGVPQHNNGEFVSTETPIEIIALDLASGVAQLCYQINSEPIVCENAINDTTFTLTKMFNFQEESQHTLTFWAIDNVGNRDETSQTHLVDDTPPLTTKTYSLLFQKLGEFAGIENFLIDWINSNTKITLTAQDQEPHPSGVKETLFNIMSRYEETDEGTHSEWFGMKTNKWYNDEELCEEENMEMSDNGEDGDNGVEPEPSPTPSPTNGDNDEESNCVEVAGWEDEELMVYEEPITIDEEGAHKICFQSIDNVNNEETQMCQVFFVDNTKPAIEILNPTLEEARRIEKCSQSIVALVEDEDSGIKRVWAELWNGSNDKVREVNLSRTIYGTYEALMDKQLPSGNYMLKVMAEDNVGNEETISIEETLTDSVFVESIFPGQCSINPEQGGSCKFTFNVCMRSANAVSFSLDKLGGIITPAMMNAEISKGEEKTFVGLLDDRIESGMLGLSEEIINGRTAFNLKLDVPANLASMIGKGVHQLNFHIKSFKK